MGNFIEKYNGGWQLQVGGGIAAITADSTGTVTIPNVPTGNMSATTVQDAINELDNEKVKKITSVDNQLVRFDGTTGEVQGSGVVVDDSGNVGIGVTPSVWRSAEKALEIGATSLSSYNNLTTSLGNNFYYNTSGQLIYKNNGYASIFSHYNGAFSWLTAPSGTAGNAVPLTMAMTLDATSKLAVTGGVSVGNVTNAGNTVLDWYEEGTFTPTVVGVTTAGTCTYSVQTGRYTRIGNRVNFSINLAWSAHTGTGSIRITSLPFVAGGGTSHVTSQSILCNNLTYTAGNIIRAYTINGTSNIGINQQVPSGTLIGVPMDTAAILYVSGSYEV